MQRTISKIASLILLALLWSNCAEEPGMQSVVVPNETDARSVASTARAQAFDCLNVLIDASHDGGVWWFPQSGTFNAADDHQGKRFADVLRSKGYKVDELARGETITADLLKNYSTVFRMTGFGSYTSSELDAYASRLDQGMSLFLFGDHTKYNPRDDVAEMLGVKWEGAVDGHVTRFAKHPLVNGMVKIEYMVGSVILNAEQNKAIHPIGWLEDGSPVMAVVDHPSSRIFIMGDVNAIEFIPSPFETNILSWIGSGCNF